MISPISLENFLFYFLISIRHIIYFWWWPSLSLSPGVSFFTFSRGTSSWDYGIFSRGFGFYNIRDHRSTVTYSFTNDVLSSLVYSRSQNKDQEVRPETVKTVLSCLPQSSFSSPILSQTTTPVLSSVFIRTVGKHEGLEKLFSEAWGVGGRFLLPSSHSILDVPNRVNISLGFSTSTGLEGSLLYSLG